MTQLILKATGYMMISTQMERKQIFVFQMRKQEILTGLSLYRLISQHMVITVLLKIFFIQIQSSDQHLQIRIRNLSNGALGYFGACAVSSRTIIVTDSMINSVK